MAASRNPAVGGVLLSTGLTLGVSGYLLVGAVMLRAGGQALPTDAMAALGSSLVLLSGVLLWVGVAILPQRI